MRIVLVAGEYSFPNNGGGIGTYTHTLARALGRLRHDVHIVTSGANRMEKEYEEEGITVHCVAAHRVLPMRGRRLLGDDLGNALYLFERALRVRDKVLQLNNQESVDLVQVPEWGGEGFWLAMRPVAPLVAVLHGPGFVVRTTNGRPPTFGSRIVEALEKHTILRANAVISPSREIRGLVAAEYGLSATKDSVTVIPNPVDTKLFSPRACDNGGGPYGSARVTFVGRLEYRKGTHVLAAAIPRIREAIPGVVFRFVGRDTPTAPSGGSMRAHIAAVAGDCNGGLEFTGPLLRQALPDYYRDSTVVALPSLQEPFGYTCAEAMACGASVVASHVGGPAEMIQHGESGYLVPPGGVTALADAIVELIRHPAERERISRNARTVAEKTFGSALVAQRMSDFYAKTIRSAGKVLCSRR